MWCDTIIMGIITFIILMSLFWKAGSMSPAVTKFTWDIKKRIAMRLCRYFAGLNLEEINWKSLPLATVCFPKLFLFHTEIYYYFPDTGQKRKDSWWGLTAVRIKTSKSCKTVTAAISDNCEKFLHDHSTCTNRCGDV